MTAKTAKFQLIGVLINHPKYPEAKAGDVLTLEVGDDGLPTSELLRNRVRQLGADLGDASEGMSDKEAKGKAKSIIEDAKKEAAAIIEKANTDAKAITDKAEADAVKMLEDVKK